MLPLPQQLLVHGTTVSLNGTAVLIRGASGTGKSDLALQLLETPGNGFTHSNISVGLVADDQTLLVREDENIYASSPATIKGLLEVRGQGILNLASTDHVRLVLVVDLTPTDQIERLPEQENLRTGILGVTLPSVAIDATKPSAAARVRVAWAACQKA
jgi:HPr kinase/phosphorylase